MNLPCLLDDKMKPRADLHPIRLTVDRSLQPLSMAEMVLPPDITKAIQNMLLVPQADARFERGMDRLRAALCGDLRNSNVFAGSTYDDHHVGTQQNGCNFYSF